MINPANSVLRMFSANWVQHKPGWALSLEDDSTSCSEGHPLEGEITALCSGGDASLPYFTPGGILWCTTAPTADSLRQVIADLRAWVLPSYGWIHDGGSYVAPQSGASALSKDIVQISPSGYFRWYCQSADLEAVVRKVSQRRHLLAERPAKSRPHRPSLYELRARFSTALLLGNRDAAEQAISEIDLYQLDSATNTQFMRIRTWHQFREFARIADHPELPRLRSQRLPPSVAQWIAEATGLVPGSSPIDASLKTDDTEIQPEASGWQEWFTELLEGDQDNSERILRERKLSTPESLSSVQVEKFINTFEQMFLDEALRKQRRELICQGVAEFLQEFVREPEFPRPALGGVYLALLRLWSVLHAGTSAGREEGHVLLELSSAVLQLNREPAEVLEAIQHWWSARRVPAQLPFLLDAIELLEREHPDRQASENLWVEAAEQLRREPERLAPSEKTLWRRVGVRLGFDTATIAEYLPADLGAEAQDILKNTGLKKIAIVCTRERQASEAASAISERTGAQVIEVACATAGKETDQAKSSDVVLFVWMTSSHAVFRAFDGFDRRKFCYVQGTGGASIVRTLERWVMTRLTEIK